MPFGWSIRRYLAALVLALALPLAGLLAYDLSGLLLFAPGAGGGNSSPCGGDVIFAAQH